MNISRISTLISRFRVPLIGTIIVVAVGLLSVAVWSMSRDFGDRGDEFLFFTVADTDLPIVITERGNLEAQVETPIRCEVESLNCAIPAATLALRSSSRPQRFGCEGGGLAGRVGFGF